MNLKAKTFRIMPCVVCGYAFSDNHHAYPRSQGGKDTIALCPNHHRYANMVQAFLMGGSRDPDQAARDFAKKYFDQEFNEKILDTLIDGFYVTCPNYVDPLSEPTRPQLKLKKVVNHG